MSSSTWVISPFSVVGRFLGRCWPAGPTPVRRRPGIPRSSPSCEVSLEGLRAALTADSAFSDGDYEDPPRAGLRAFSRVYAGWGLSQAFSWERLYEQLGFATLEDFLVGFWEANFGD